MIAVVAVWLESSLVVLLSTVGLLASKICVGVGNPSKNDASTDSGLSLGEFLASHWNNRQLLKRPIQMSRNGVNIILIASP